MLGCSVVVAVVAVGQGQQGKRKGEPECICNANACIDAPEMRRWALKKESYNPRGPFNASQLLAQQGSCASDRGSVRRWLDGLAWKLRMEIKQCVKEVRGKGKQNTKPQMVVAVEVFIHARQASPFRTESAASL